MVVEKTFLDRVSVGVFRRTLLFVPGRKKTPFFGTALFCRASEGNARIVWLIWADQRECPWGLKTTKYFGPARSFRSTPRLGGMRLDLKS